MKQVPYENNLLDCNKNLQLVKNAVKKNLDVFILDQLKFQKKKIKSSEKMKLKKQKIILIH